ncbi:MAG: putative porin [Paludibacter sp.]|nr:putative porin [Paludibacter sp.]
MKKHFLILIIFNVLAGNIFSQNIDNKPVKRLKVWHVEEFTATADTVSADTLHLNFQDNNPVDRFSIANSYNGNMLSPLESKIYFVRPLTDNFLFGDAYFPYIRTINNINFFNTNTPFSNITYKSGGSTFRWEEKIAFLFTANLSKRLNIGTTIDYSISHGEYNNQEAQLFAPSIFATYDGRRYKFTTAVLINTLSNYENGGITDPRYITLAADEFDIDTKNIPVKLQKNTDTGPFGYSRYRYREFFYNHQYCIGFEKEVTITPDSSRFDYIPVTRIIHTLKIDEQKKRYFEPQTVYNPNPLTPSDSIISTFYENTYFPQRGQTNDSCTLSTITNTVALHIEEEFNKWFQFGLTAYVSNEYQHFYLANPDSTSNRISFMNTKAGGILSKTQGKIFRYNIQGEIGIQGYKAGNFLVKADLGGYFRLWNDSVVLRAEGFMRLDAPPYFDQHYNSNHFSWDNEFTNIYRTQLGGALSIPTRGITLNAKIENVLNYIYYDENALPAQYGKNIQIFALAGHANLNILKWLGWETEAVYQVSSQPDMLALPAFAVFTNLYYNSQWFKVLEIQAGVNLRYNTAYYAPNYMPATGRFYVQNNSKIGNFPLINAYLNFHLKQARIFVEYYHINQLFVRAGNYFSMPNYPLNPAILKWGVSWNFYN